MKKIAGLLTLMLVATVLTGCGGDKDRGMNRPDQRKDLPRAAPPEKDK